MLSPVLAGLGLGLSLIIAIGAQNMFVLRQGLRREHILAVVLICTASDATLILLGVSGLGLALQALPWLVDAVRWVGAAFLLTYAVLAARRAIRPTGEALHAASSSPAASPADGTVATATRTALPVVLACLALTWLNPHVYLDTVFLLGTVANTHGDARWWFALGAACASALWFFGLGFGARLLGPWLATPRAWRIVDCAIAVIMAALAVNLALGA
ncbi:LysE/ArgO family amino acid transporter [Microbacterium horticulturae]|uniref:LysE/ArgO family amino acid transporter n=1 Tax=Microbacterium horticulturae TaxID=3028316 RepID=A0ABY8C2Y5_9MICO|nr:LysE/ArgO family amino acid transporter [Microbacterium sp. KACC 23027]WEG09712.1 LysE/ArgO family amino acid transporter [Microbacterium sp. KACC 23027]